ncbi:MAG: hypothetical protein HYZ29_23340 [Myxococcales bacterium]|nr:hypothetical protein [Myxococcales bacterium]
MAKLVENADDGLWVHRDDAGIAAVVEAGLARAKAQDWASGTSGDRERALRGVLIETARCMGELAGKKTAVVPLTVDDKEIGKVAYVHPAPVAGATAERQRAAVVLYRSVELIAEGNRRGLGFATIETKTDAGAWPIVAVAAVVSIGQAAAIGYVAFQAAQVIDRQLQRRHDLKVLLAEHAKELELVSKHVEREKLAGKPLPLDDATKASLNATIKRQNDIAAKQQGPLSSGLPNVDAAAGGFGLGAVLALGAVAWFWFSK